MTTNVDKTTLNVLSLCTGGGGLDLGLALAVETARVVCCVEHEAYCAAVLDSGMEAETMDDAPIWTNLKTFDGGLWRGLVDIVIGGYPCTPFSVAGQQRGADDPRHLWPDVARIVEQVQPGLCFFENVANHLALGADTVFDSLEGMGYDVTAGLFTAEEVGATQKRNRLFIMASTGSLGRWQGAKEPKTLRAVHQDTRNINFTDRPSNEGLSDFPPGPADLDAWREVLGIDPSLEPALCRMADGMAPRVDRLRMLGNGVVPLQAAYAFLSLWAAASRGNL